MAPFGFVWRERGITFSDSLRLRRAGLPAAIPEMGGLNQQMPTRFAR